MMKNSFGLAGCGLAGWLTGKLRGGRDARPRLELVERIALAPRQSLALVEAEGQRILVATSPEGAPAFYALDERSNAARALPVLLPRQSGSVRPTAKSAARVSW